MLTDDDVKLLKKVIVEPLEKRMVSVEGKVDHLTDRVESVEGKVDNLTDRVDDLTGRVGSLEGNVEKLEARVNAVYLIVKEDRKELGKRIDRLEKRSGLN